MNQLDLFAAPPAPEPVADDDDRWVTWANLKLDAHPFEVAHVRRLLGLEVAGE